MDDQAAYREHLRRHEREDPARVQEGYAVWFDDALPAARGRALDYGAGRGHGVDYLASRGFAEVEAFDVDPDLVSALRGRASAVHASAAPREWLQAQAGRYDLILAKDVVEHLPHEETLATVGALLGALRPEGRLVVSVPHAVSFSGVYVRYADFTHRTAFTESSLRYVLEGAGGRAVRFHAPRFGPPRSPKTLAYRALKRAWFGALRAIYFLETPDPAALPSHFHPRLVASAAPGGRA
ncbi:MAG: class I SAM-dependent methyltransferase [Planctomycetota bacterium]